VSDQQLVTCVAVLLVAIIKLADGSLTVYHFSICSDLAWFCNAVDTMTLDVLSSYFRRRVKKALGRTNTLDGQYSPNEVKVGGRVKKRPLPLMTSVRMTLMSICGALLLFCLVMQGYRSWTSIFACPANCARKDLVGHYGGLPGVASTIMIASLLTTQPIAVMALTNTGFRFFEDVRSKHMKKLGQMVPPSSHPLAMPYTALTKGAAVMWDYYSSIICRAILNLSNIILGVFSILVDRALGRSIMESQNVDGK
ncbi:hypothetical protein LTR22_027561, partial [Elasticomyces elasticus]